MNKIFKTMNNKLKIYYQLKIWIKILNNVLIFKIDKMIVLKIKNNNKRNKNKYKKVYCVLYNIFYKNNYIYIFLIEEEVQESEIQEN